MSTEIGKTREKTHSADGCLVAGPVIPSVHCDTNPGAWAVTAALLVAAAAPFVCTADATALLAKADGTPIPIGIPSPNAAIVDRRGIVVVPNIGVRCEARRITIFGNRYDLSERKSERTR